jgi:uncharacterized protein
MKTVVLYHADCPDGFGASYAAWKKFGLGATYVAVQHDTELPAMIEGADVYTLDYAYKSEVIKSLLPKIASLTIIDHHVTAEESVKLATKSVFNMDHSGAVLAWQYFHPDIPVPKLLQYVEDNDLWRFALPNSREITEALSLNDLDFELWDKVTQDLENETVFAEYVRDGRILLKQKEKTVAHLLENAEDVEFEGYHCKMVNTPMHSSLIGSELVKAGSPIGIMWSRRGQKIVVSLRSNGNPDVAAIAQKYGGGGHSKAAGFSWEEKEFLRFKR